MKSPRRDGILLILWTLPSRSIAAVKKFIEEIRKPMFASRHEYDVWLTEHLKECTYYDCPH